MTRTLWQKQNKTKQIKWLAPGILIVQVYKNSPHTWGLLARPFLANYINFLNVLEYVRINLREPLCNLNFFLHHLLHLKTQSLYHSVNNMVLTPHWAIVFLTPFWLNFVRICVQFSFPYTRLHHSYAGCSNTPCLFFSVLFLRSMMHQYLNLYKGFHSVYISHLYVHGTRIP